MAAPRHQSARGSGSSFELRMALRYLSTRRREGAVTVVTLLCMGGVFVGVAALVLGLALMMGLQGDIRTRLLASNPHVVVTPGWGAPPFTQEQADAVARIAESDPRVVASAPVRHVPGLLRSRLAPKGRFAVIKAIDPAREDLVTGLAAKTGTVAWERLVADVGTPPATDDESSSFPSDLAAPEPPAVLLGTELALRLGVSTGDVVHLLTGEVALSALGPQPRSRAFRVAGLLDTGLHEYDGTWGLMNIARETGLDGGADGVQLALRDPLRSSEVAADLADRLGRNHAVSDWTTTFSRLFAAFRWEKLILMIALGLIGLVAGFNIFTILSMNVMARVADIGILSALGATSGAVTRIFVWMGLGIGGAGTIGGLAAGTLVAGVLDRYRLITLDPSVYIVSHVPFRVEPQDLALVAAGMLLVSLLATILPARAASRLDPVVALRVG